MSENILDLTQFIHLLGTAHFTKRSIREACQAIKYTGTRDLAIELDLKRFNIMNRRCIQCPNKNFCSLECEFTAASDALGNTDANIWLIDMSEYEVRDRIRILSKYVVFRNNSYLLRDFDNEKLPWLWEKGFKDEVLRRSKERLDSLRRSSPHVWRVLIEERNALMSARLLEISSNKLKKNEKPNILALVGAAHVEGIRSLLKNSASIESIIQELNLKYTPPTLVKRIQIDNL